MASQQVRTALGQLHRLLGPAGAPAISDSQLLEDFVVRRDEKSFEVLVWRHAALVLGICNRVLRDSHLAEDAFQAAILVFARKAPSIGKRESVAGWLYKVAYRIALRAKSKSAKSQTTEPLPDVPERDRTEEAEWRELRPVLDEEIGRLPEKYRVPFVLCYLEGQTNEQAAEQIGCPKGTVLSRLSRGRDWLRSRLVRRGVALSSASLATVLTSQAASAAAPASLVSSTITAAIPFAAGTTTAGLVSPAVYSLTEGVLHAMFLTKLKIAAAIVALAVLGTGVGVVGPRAFASENATETVQATVPLNPQPETPAAVADPAKEIAKVQQRERPNVKGPDAAGKVVAVAKDAASFSIETPSKERGGEPGKTEIKIGPKTTITYHGVTTNGAKPTEGYNAVVMMEDAAKGLAASVVFQGTDNSRGRGNDADFMGKVAAIAKDGKGITLEVLARGRGEDGKTAEVLFDAKTIVVFSGVGKDGAKIVEGQLASVQLLDGTKNNTAGVVTLTGADRPALRRDVAQGQVISGKLVSGDDKSLTIAQGGGRGEEPTKVTIKLTDKSTVLYHNVVIGAARPAEGMNVQIWLAEGSKDEAATAVLVGTPPERWTTINGKVISVGKDGSSITFEQPAMARGEEPTKLVIAITADTKVSYATVGPNEAKPTEGYMAQVRLLEGSKDTAAQIVFSKPAPPGERGR